MPLGATAAALPIALIVAAAANGVIGRGGRLPWRMPSDLRTFRRLTLGKPVIMGRRTFQSIGKPLDGRDNIVITRDVNFSSPGVLVANSIEAAIRIARSCADARNATEIMIIGGAEIYAQALPLADRIYLTCIDANPDGDATFTDPDPAQWRLIEATPIPPDPRDEYTARLLVHQRRVPA